MKATVHASPTFNSRIMIIKLINKAYQHGHNPCEGDGSMNDSSPPHFLLEQQHAAG
jgi:hypothetical protein